MKHYFKANSASDQTTIKPLQMDVIFQILKNPRGIPEKFTWHIWTLATLIYGSVHEDYLGDTVLIYFWYIETWVLLTASCHGISFPAMLKKQIISLKYSTLTWTSAWTSNDRQGVRQRSLQPMIFYFTPSSIDKTASLFRVTQNVIPRQKGHWVPTPMVHQKASQLRSMRTSCMRIIYPSRISQV